MYKNSNTRNCNNNFNSKSNNYNVNNNNNKEKQTLIKLYLVKELIRGMLPPTLFGNIGIPQS